MIGARKKRGQVGVAAGARRSVTQPPPPPHPHRLTPPPLPPPPLPAAPTCRAPPHAPRTCASYATYVPDGSAANSCGPRASQPARSNETPNGRDILDLFSSPPSPNDIIRSHTDCVSDSTRMGSSYVKRWLCPSTRACSTSVRASAVSPLMATPMWLSTSWIFSMDVCSSSGDVSRFSTPRMTPPAVRTATAQLPSCGGGAGAGCG